jgi:diguanylate cyclase (GGDEF)-like protein
MKSEKGISETGNVVRLETCNGKLVANEPREELGELGMRLCKELHAAQTVGQKAQLLVFRISNYSLLVDTFGAEFGAAAEAAVLEQLRSKLRKREPVQKLKGGEFAIVGRGIQSVNSLGAMARRMVEGGTGHYEIKGTPCRLKIDIGASACPEDSHDPEELLRFARFALADPDAEQGNYSSFSQERFIKQKKTFWIEAEMEKALAESRFKLVYQPQFAIDSGRITGVEALARLYTTDGYQIQPNEFIPVAEDNGFIVQLGQWVIQEACRQLAHWRRTGCQVPRVSVNMSPRQLSDPELLATIETAISEGDLGYGDLEIEITERCVVEESRVVIELLQALRARGVRIAIDDFGTGYSSFAYLAGQPLDMVKLDRSFLARVGNDERIGAVLSGMIEMSRKLGMEVIAEGVESNRQAEFLRDNGCELAQGFALARPQDPERIVQLFSGVMGAPLEA